VIVNTTMADRFGLVRPGVDAHTLGVCSVEQLLKECGFHAIVADAPACEAFGQPERPNNADIIERWIRTHRVTVLGFSYRLDPQEGAAVFARLVHQIKDRCLLKEQGGPLRALCFAGLPRTCELVRSFFQGDETPAETLRLLGINPGLMARALAEGTMYDDTRLALAKDLISKEEHLDLMPVDRSGYPEFGTKEDTLVARIRHGIERRLPPLMRAHVGPFLPDRAKALRLFHHWIHQLAVSGFLDVL